MKIALALLLSILCAGPARARPHRIAGPDPQIRLPTRIVIEEGGVRVSNCLFSTVQLPERMRPGMRALDEISAGQPIWGRCYLPDPLGKNRPGELVDVITIDGQVAWRQGYTKAVAPSALSRSVPYGELLRTVLARLKPGFHRVTIVGERKGRKLYEGSFRYVR